MAAMRRIRALLRPGGVWLNAGPLHWHHPAAGMLRLPLDELLALLAHHGFGRIERRRLGAVPYLASGGEGGLLRRLLLGARAAAVTSGDEWHDVAYWAAEVAS